MKPFTLIASIFLMVFIGCASVPTGYERVSSSALNNTETTTLGQVFAPLRDAHPGDSGFLLLNTGKEGLAARVALMQSAERSIDVQTFLWHSDDVGHIMTNSILKAADRGVRVRVLIDDIGTKGRDVNIAAFDAHPNVEIRIFNAFGRRSGPRIFKGFEFLFNISRLNVRMHNKILAVDNQAAIIGGRNIGNHYFGVDQYFHFRDMDVLTAGAIVDEVSGSFDDYWNSEWAVPISVLVENLPEPEQVEEKRKALHDYIGNIKDFPFELPEDSADVMDHLEDLLNEFIWASTRIVFDSPDKVEGDYSRNLGSELSLLAGEAKEEILIVSPYFIPGTRSVKKSGELTNSGVDITVLTNSLASTNSPVSYAAYSRYRKKMLRKGISIHELRHDAEDRGPNSYPYPDSHLALHAKLAVFDHRTVYIGSFNFDPRGVKLNTEVGLIIESPELASKVIEAIDVDLKPANSWTLKHNVDRNVSNTNGTENDTIWTANKKGKEVTHFTEPDVGISRSLKTLFFMLLPIEGQL